MTNNAVKRVLVGLVGLSLAVTTACSSSGNGDSTQETSSGSAGGLDEKQVAEAKMLVEKGRGDIKFIAPGRPFDVSGLKGKKIYFITIDSVPFIERAYDSMRAAGEPLGIEVKIVSGKGQTAAVAAGVEQAIAAGADAILVGSTDFKFIPEAVKAANNAKVPIVGLLNVSSDMPIPQGSSGEVTLDYRISGEMLVAWAVADAKEPFDGLYVNIPAVATFDALSQGVNDGFKKYCSVCNLTSVDVQQANLKQTTESKTQAELRRNDKIKWVFPAIDLMAQFGVPAVQALGRKDVQIGSINAVDANLSFIQAGTVQSVDVGNNNSWMGYAALDRLMRAMLGEPPAISEIPIKLFDKSNLEGQDVKNEDELFGVDYRAEYGNLWKGVG